MEAKIVGLIFIATILGSLLGFGMAYWVFQPQLQNLSSSQDALVATSNSLQDELNNLNSSVSSLNSTVNEINERIWHEASSLEGNGNALGPVFQIRGKSVRIRWTMFGLDTTSWIQILLKYSNGTTYAIRGSSGTFSSFACDLEIEEPMNYFLEIITYNVYSYTAYLWDYY